MSFSTATILILSKKFHYIQLFKPCNINQECQEREERCRQTNNRNNSNEVSDEGELLLVEEH